MGDKDDRGNKIFGAIRFRNLVNQVSDLNTEEVPDMSLYQEAVTETERKPKFFVTLFQKLRSLGDSTNILGFIAQLLTYFYRRARVIYILLSVFIEVISNAFDNLKRLVVRSLFWGRTNFLKNLMQIGLAFVLIVILVVNTTRSSYTRSVVASNKYGDNILNTIATGESAKAAINRDLIVQTATTNTDTKNDTQRLDVVEYTVKNGDSLSSIGEFYGVSVQTILWANNMTSGHIIRPGQVLRIPPSNGVVVKVNAGDTVNSLAQKYNANSQSIIDFNWIDPPFTLTEGREIFIPDGVMPPTPTPRVAVWIPIDQSNRYVNPSVGRFVQWPVADGRGTVSQCFSGAHNGVDIADGGAPDLVAAADGVVTFAGMNIGSGAGWSISIDHGNGYTTVYAHMSALYVTSGQQVSAGQAIGRMGMTGYASGIHVHFMLWQGRAWNSVNPAAYMTRSICGY